MSPQQTISIHIEFVLMKENQSTVVCETLVKTVFVCSIMEQTSMLAEYFAVNNETKLAN